MTDNLRSRSDVALTETPVVLKYAARANVSHRFGSSDAPAPDTANPVIVTSISVMLPSNACSSGVLYTTLLQPIDVTTNLVRSHFLTFRVFDWRVSENEEPLIFLDSASKRVERSETIRDFC